MWSWMVAVALATTTGVVVHRTLAAAEAGADRYGSPRSVVMPNRELAAGQVVGDEDVTVTVVPASSGSGWSPRGTATARCRSPSDAASPDTPGAATCASTRA